ncbi:TSUP family transporter [Streptomyces sp. RPA4-5]|uniref:TSUP family transporter n=1 Tax=Streptomyces TaxID=1883 RepID=UPI00143E2B65|nr:MULTISPECIES: TSUP family transporter [Streptomyces]MCX4640753.1 TSUP family transporter [Streptomyces platensis]QIY55965.1 TSUP family transporter [Streptomyces sp. RPA4-5]WJY38806.1 TSUP family transporter [Streptomyces sp. P9-2B-2]
MSVLVALAALPCGLLIGLLLGALGGGGSVLAVPALVYLLGQSPHEATAGALVVVTVGAVTGLLCHGRAGRVRWAAGAAFGALGTAGSYLGSRWSATMDPTVLMAAFSGLLLVVAAMLVLRGRGERRTAAETRPLGEPREGTPLRDAPEAVPLRGAGERDSLAEPGERLSPQEPAETLPSQKPSETAPLRDTAVPAPSSKTNGFARPAPPRPVRFAVTASAVGLLTGFFGVGGGFVVVPALTLVLGLEMPVAIGTSLLVILINSLTALATRAGTGSLDWPLLAGFAACAALGSHLGNRLTTRLRPQVLATAFACLVTVLAVIMAATALPRLW